MPPRPPTPGPRGPLPRRQPHREPPKQPGPPPSGQKGSSSTSQALRQAAVETRKIHGKTSYKYTLKEVTRLDSQYCPNFPQPATIRVVNDDTTNAGLSLAAAAHPAGMDWPQHDWNPLIVNFANEHVPGGGWLGGALAQEETIFYRSSLSFSLFPEQYPLADGAVYSPYVLVVRDDIASGHRLMDFRKPRALPVLGAVTVAAIRGPAIRTVDVPGRGSRARQKQVFARDSERNVTKGKMRLTLRMAAYNRHRRLVLGALGCGCWLEVLREDEFLGNWWDDVWFAVYDLKKTGNFEVFKRVLDGKTVCVSGDVKGVWGEVVEGSSF
ncbi:hypothetical protein C8A01DRAFT_47463 [Parachaetomium inaequale]|uniref:Microbial-type PARG catalytic domain-containing protein n=1 Tax=Parachaetomium inaequale TaxID=2588326 RepID=A0AAN6PDK5_9PEZI|nr:hypothetical protein C8A01DRAFT_47463 [Parachaetomium inaequale]